MNRIWSHFAAAIFFVAVSSPLLHAASPPAKAPKTDFAALAPEDAFWFLGTNDMKALLGDLDKSAVGRLWDDKAVQGFVKPIRESLTGSVPGLAQDGFTFEAFKKLVPGRAAVWCEALEPYKPHEFGTVVALDRTDAPEAYRKWIDKLYAESPVPITKTNMMFRGVRIDKFSWDLAETLPKAKRDTIRPELRFSTKHSFSFAFPEGRALLAKDGDESIQRLLTRESEAAGKSLAAKPDFQKIASVVAAPQFVAYYAVGANLKASTATTALFARKGDPPGPTYEATGLLDVESVAWAADFDEKGFLHAIFVNTKPEPKGLAKAFNAFRPIEERSLSLAPKGVYSIGAYGFDLPVLLQEVMTFYKQGDPEFAKSIVEMNTQLQKTSGITSDQVIPAFGDQLSIFTVIGKETSSMAYGLRLKNSAAVRKLIETGLQQQIGAPLKKSDYQGAAVYTAAAPAGGEFKAPEGVPVIALTSDYLVIGADVETVRATIRRLAGRESETFLSAHTPNPRQYSGHGDWISYSYTDYSRIQDDLQSVFYEAQTLTSALGLNGGLGIAPWFDFAALPKASAVKKYMGHSEAYGYHKPGATVFITRIEKD